MRTARYGFFGEDDAQRLFLRHYLVALTAGQDFVFEEDRSFPLVGLNKSRVKAQFAEACELGLSQQYRHDCFFVGLDLDDFDPSVFRETVAGMQARLRDRDVSAILLIPVQCIEHWLWYLRWRSENLRSTKNEPLETKTRKEAKINLYGTPKPATRISNPIVEQLAAGMDIAWLASRSASFLAFHTQVQQFLAAQ